MDGGDISSFVTNGEWDLIGKTDHHCTVSQCLFQCGMFQEADYIKTLSSN